MKWYMNNTYQLLTDKTYGYSCKYFASKYDIAPNIINSIRISALIVQLAHCLILGNHQDKVNSAPLDLSTLTLSPR